MQTFSLALAWFVRHLFCRHIYSSFEYLGCRDHEKIAHRTIITIIIQSLISVQDKYDLLLYGDTMSWRDHVFPNRSPFFDCEINTNLTKFKFRFGKA